MLDLFASLGWVQAIALAAVLIAAIAAAVFLIGEWQANRHERIQTRLEHEHELETSFYADGGDAREGDD